MMKAIINAEQHVGFPSAGGFFYWREIIVQSLPHVRDGQVVGYFLLLPGNSKLYRKEDIKEGFEGFKNIQTGKEIFYGPLNISFKEEKEEEPLMEVKGELPETDEVLPDLEVVEMTPETLAEMDKKRMEDIAEALKGEDARIKAERMKAAIEKEEADLRRRGLLKNKGM